MLVCMKRTTILLPGDLLVQAKKEALERGTTLTALVVAGLRNILARKRKDRTPRAIKLITYGSGGVAPGVDLDDTSSLLDIMESNAADRR